LIDNGDGRGSLHVGFVSLDVEAGPNIVGGKCINSMLADLVEWHLRTAFLIELHVKAILDLGEEAFS
jgi:hypothetical protein